ncbi:2ODD19 [Symbiodinium necroappetens]|uniref:2ODD19 protein n=1 Tax=Symbiodinium necroappetens TaxID=1628268 RepID=A0A812T9W6_9DINO|nr:2ODD19 [Symbiodinium necroappetens]
MRRYALSQVCIRTHHYQHHRHPSIYPGIHPSVHLSIHPSEQAKYHEPDNRVAFGLSESSAKSQFVDWGDLKWAPEGYMALKAAVAKMFESEVASLCSTENGSRDLLGVKLRLGWEKWGRSGLRHCVYPAEGTCSSHTDYGVVTLQLSNGPGLEVFAHGSWQVLEEPPEGGALLFAGDMLERLTNGQIKALPHRVHVQKESMEASGTWPLTPQSHIIFLQPDSDTWVAPLKPYLLNNGNDLAPIRYGDWHQMKVRLAFDGSGAFMDCNVVDLHHIFAPSSQGGDNEDKPPRLSCARR